MFIFFSFYFLKTTKQHFTEMPQIQGDSDIHLKVIPLNELGMCNTIFVESRH